MSRPRRIAELVSDDHFNAHNWRAFLQNVMRKEREVSRVTRVLEHWRRRTWLRAYQDAPFGPRGVLPDIAVKSLAARHTWATVEDLESLHWLLLRKHGPEVLAVMALVDMPAALAELRRQHADHMAKQAAAAEREKKRLDEEHQRAERSAQRERNRIAKENAEADRKKKAEDRKRAAEQKRREAEEKKARMPWKKWYKKTATVAKGWEVTRKRKVAAGEWVSPSKRQRVDKENIAPECVLDAVPVLASTSSLQTPPCPRPRPRPRPVPRGSPSTSSGPQSSGGLLSMPLPTPAKYSTSVAGSRPRTGPGPLDNCNLTVTNWTGTATISVQFAVKSRSGL